MADKKKMTVVENYTNIQKILNGETVEDYTPAMGIAFLATRIEQTQKKNMGKDGEKKLTKTQQENEVTKETIMAVLATATEPMTITDLGKMSAEMEALSHHKLSALVSQLVKAGRVVRTEDKGRAYFALPTAETEGE